MYYNFFIIFCIFAKCTNGQSLLTGGSSTIPNKTKGTSIMFIVDTSNYTMKYFQSRIKNYLLGVMEHYNDRPNTHIGLTTYHSWIYKTFPLKNNDGNYKQAVKRIFSGGAWRYMHLALRSAKAMLRTASSTSENRILVIVSAGRSNNYFRKSGFMLSRKQALIMRNEGVFIMAVALNTLFRDFRVLRACVSANKYNHIVQSEDYKTAVTQSTQVIDKFTSEGLHCTQDYADIGILIEPSSNLSMSSASKFLSNVQKHNNEMHHFRFLQLQSGIWRRKYRQYENREFSLRVNEIFRYSLHEIEIAKRINRAINEEMTEDFDANSLFKLLLVITVDPLDSEELNNSINRGYKEAIHLINVVQNFNTSASSKNEQVALLTRLLYFKQFGLSEWDKLFSYIDKTIKKTACI